MKKLIDVHRISVWLVFIFFGTFHGFLKLLFENSIAILHRAQLLGEYLFAHLFLLVEAFNHFIERRQGFCLLLVRKQSTSLCVNREISLTTGTDDREFRT